MSYLGQFLACQGVDCTFRWKGLIGNDNLPTEGICQFTSLGCLSASTATISTGRLADRSCCQRPQVPRCCSINSALVSSCWGVLGFAIRFALTSSKDCMDTRAMLFLIIYKERIAIKTQGERSSWRAALKCFQAIRAVQQDPGHQSHLNIFHSWGHRMQGMIWQTHNRPTVSSWPL